AGAEAADQGRHSGPDVSLRLRPDAYADVPPGRGPGDRQGLASRPPEMDSGRVLQGVLRGRRREDALPAVVLPVHRAVNGSGHPVRPLGRRGALRRGQRLAGDSRLRDGASERAQERRARSGRVSGLCVGHGDRPHRHAEIRHAGSARVLRGGCALAEALRLPPARPADAGRGTQRMKFTLSWLKMYLDTNASLEEIVEKLTLIGLEVESVEDRAKALAPFTVAHVVSAVQHPNADRLRLCMVDTGSGEPVQVVCGAPNARTGLVSVFAPPGTYIPGKNITLSVGTIRGVESRGMLISPAEIELSDDHDGIIELPADAPVGASYVEWAGLGDPVLDINLTPNRPDCTGAYGIAR